MHFLIDASLPRSTGNLLRRLGHQATDVRDLGKGVTLDSQIAEHARSNGLAILTADFDFADIRVYPPADFRGIVVIDRPESATILEV